MLLFFLIRALGDGSAGAGLSFRTASGVLRGSRGSSLETEFFGLGWFVLIPIRSMLVTRDGYLVTRVDGVPLNALSVITAYARGWGLPLALYGLLALAIGWQSDWPSDRVAAIGVAAVGVALFVGSFWTLLRPVGVSRALGMYAPYFGHAVPAALLGAQSEIVREHLWRSMHAALEASGTFATYRDAGTTDPNLLRKLAETLPPDHALAAPTLALLALEVERAASSAERAELRRVHDALLARLAP